MARIPAYVSSCKQQGEVAKLHNDGFYHLYKRTSRRTGKDASPVVELVEVAIATSNGRKELSEFRRPIFEAFLTREVGFSYASSGLLSPKWKASLGEDWESVYHTALSFESPDSYLLMNRKVTFPAGRNMDLQVERTWNNLPGGKKTLLELQVLKSIRAVYYSDRIVVSKPTAEQAAILAKYNISLEGILL